MKEFLITYFDKEINKYVERLVLSPSLNSLIQKYNNTLDVIKIKELNITGSGENGGILLG